ncbi:uncharacterized protein [Rutidosis leptorrhynchoides]|uniref:uncharacterized protein n=1 Tax=Rutidosis leptorrhynchoides TaxID=125765 RepID=UPI003A99BCB7
MDFKIASWNIRGMCNIDKQNEVKKFISEERVYVCAILETHLKPDSVGKVGNNVFKEWKWVSNCYLSPNSCRIMLGWDHNMMNVMVLQITRQVIFCLIESVDCNIKMYCSYVYASNSGKERHNLWKDLRDHCSISQGYPWVIMGDFNITRYANEHSNGCSHSTEEMNEFNDLINNIEVDDLGCSGCFFTWTKSLKNPVCGTLKKLDRILCNED